MPEEIEAGRTSKYRRMSAVVPLAFLIFSGIVLALDSVSAGVAQELPVSLANSLGVDVATAKLVLSCGMLMAAGLILAVIGKRGNMMASIVVMIGTAGALVGMSWLPAWVLLLLGMVVAIQFGAKVGGWFEDRK